VKYKIENHMNKTVTVMHPTHENRIIKLKPCGNVIFVDSEYVEVGYIGGFPVFQEVYGDIQGLPPEKEDVYVLTYRKVLQALLSKGMQRDDIIIPGEPVKDQKGNTIACLGFKF
jgi:hypothetical protein